MIPKADEGGVNDCLLKQKINFLRCNRCVYITCYSNVIINMVKNFSHNNKKFEYFATVLLIILYF